MQLPLILLLGFATVLLFVLALAKPKQKEDVEGRLKRVKQDAPQARLGRAPWEAAEAEAGEGSRKKAALADFNRQLDEMLGPLADRYLTPEKTDALRQAAHRAGRYARTGRQVRLWQLKAAMLAPLPVIWLLFLLEMLNPTVIVWAGLGAFLGFQFPLLQLKQEGEQRRKAILRALPSMLDLLTICVEAGLSLQAALIKVVEKARPGPFRDELDQVLREIQFGRPRAEALKAMAGRVDLKEVHSVVLGMVQAEAMGTSVAKNLRIQSEIARENRWSRAQEQAMQAPVKLTFPLVLFIFPVIFIVIFGPVALEFLASR